MSVKHQLTTTTIKVNLLVTIDDDQQAQLLIVNLTHLLYFMLSIVQMVGQLWVTFLTFTQDFKQAALLTKVDLQTALGTAYKLIAIAFNAVAYGIGISQ